MRVGVGGIKKEKRVGGLEAGSSHSGEGGGPGVNI
jgi:hypothetical protein